MDQPEGRDGIDGVSRNVLALNPRDLWKWMAAFQQKTGNALSAIAPATGLLGTRTNPNVAAASDLSNLIYP